MRLDDERQRELLLKMIEDMTIPGTMLDEILVLRQRIRKAAIEPEPPPEQPTS